MCTISQIGSKPSPLSLSIQMHVVFISDGGGFSTICLSCPLEVAIERNKLRSDGQVGSCIIARMNDRLQIPDFSKNSWEKYSLVTDSSSLVDMCVGPAVFVYLDSSFYTCHSSAGASVLYCQLNIASHHCQDVVMVARMW